LRWAFFSPPPGQCSARPLRGLPFPPKAFPCSILNLCSVRACYPGVLNRGYFLAMGTTSTIDNSFFAVGRVPFTPRPNRERPPPSRPASQIVSSFFFFSAAPFGFHPILPRLYRRISDQRLPRSVRPPFRNQMALVISSPLRLSSSALVS